MPTHQTKLTMSQPQATGTLMPQMPMPFRNSHPTDTRKRLSSANESANAGYHHLGVFCRTTALIWSVTELGVWPGATIGARDIGARDSGALESRSVVSATRPPVRDSGF